MAEEETVYKVVLVGSSGGGKTSLIQRFLHDKFLETPTTPKADHYEKKINLDGEDVLLSIFETPEDMIKNACCTGGDGFIVVFSILDEDSFETAQEIITRTQKNAGKKTPIILVGNKSDMDDERTVSNKDATKVAKKYKVDYVETSAKNGENVPKAFHDMGPLMQGKKDGSGGSCCEIM